MQVTNLPYKAYKALTKADNGDLWVNQAEYAKAAESNVDLKKTNYTSILNQQKQALSDEGAYILKSKLFEKVPELKTLSANDLKTVLADLFEKTDVEGLKFKINSANIYKLNIPIAIRLKLIEACMAAEAERESVKSLKYRAETELSVPWLRANVTLKDLTEKKELEKDDKTLESQIESIDKENSKINTAGIIECGTPPKKTDYAAIASWAKSQASSTSTNTTTIVNNPASTTPATTTPTTTPITTPSTPAATYITPTLNFPAINQSATVSLSIPVNNGVSTIPSNFTLALDLKKERWDGSWTQIGIQNAEITDTDLSGINAATGFDLDSKGYRIKYKGTLKDTSGNTANGSAVTFYNGYTYFPVSLDYRSGFEHVQNGTMTAADFGAGKNKITTSFIITGAGLSANIVPSSSGTDQQWSITQDAQSNYRATITPLGGTKLLLGDDIAIANKIDPTTLQSTPLDVYAGQTYTCIGNNFVSGSPNLYHVTLIKITSVTATQIGYELLFKTTPIDPTVSSTIETGSGLPTPPLP